MTKDAPVTDYELMESWKSNCPDCGNRVWLLSPKHIFENTPSFFICFKCSTVGQVGKGPVPKV